MYVNLVDTVVIKEENLFLLSFRDGTLPADGPHPLGLWYRDCRFLSGHELRLNGVRVELLQASDSLGTRALHEMTNPDLPLPSGATLPAQALSVHIDRALEGSHGLRELIAVRSHYHDHLQLDLELRLAADFESMLEVRGLAPLVARSPPEVELDGRALRFSSRGRDGVVRTTAVQLSDEPADAAAGPASAHADGTIALRFAFELPAGGMHELKLGFAASESGDAAAPSIPRRPHTLERTRVSSDDQLFDRVLARSLQDLELLRSELNGHTYFAAGVPWFATLFGRDSLITAMETLSMIPGVAEETLRLLGGLLGRELDDAHDEEPGKVLHELRVGELATLGETPYARYYGTADATPLWLCLLCDQADWSGSLDLFHELRPQVDAALGWIEHYGDLDGDGLVEYRRRAPHGLDNQGWKDSHDGVPYESGQPLEPPVALVEVQGYVIRALRRVARLLDLDGERGHADDLRARAAVVEAALERFWLEDPGGYAIGLDGAKRAGSGLTSNQGHLLWAAVVSQERAQRVRDVLMDERMFSGWGIRTLAEGHPGFNPVGYHTGSVWPHDNALIAFGLRRYGFDEDYEAIFEALLETASQFGDYRLPELFGGYARKGSQSPVPYPVACEPQAWAAGAIPYLLKCGLGLAPDGLSHRLRIVRPSLPSWLGFVEVAGLRVAGASVDLTFERTGSHVTLADARIRGDLEVVLEIAGDRRTLTDV